MLTDSDIQYVHEQFTPLADPNPGDDAWLARLRSEVDELDELERPFSPHYDRERFGRPPTRDELIAEPRRLSFSSSDSVSSSRTRPRSGGARAGRAGNGPRTHRRPVDGRT